MKDGLTTAGYCGLFCEACGAYIGTTQEPERLEQMAKRFNRTVEEIQCRGCRSDTLSFYCATCAMKSCITEKGLSFCSECENYPCGTLKDFQTQAPHRLELFESLDYVKAHGAKRWREKMERDYACAGCKTVNGRVSGVLQKLRRSPAQRICETQRENDTGSHAEIGPDENIFESCGEGDGKAIRQKTVNRTGG